VLEDSLPSTRRTHWGKEQGGALIWLVRAFSLTGILFFIALMWIQSWHEVSAGVVFMSAAWAGLGLLCLTGRMVLLKQARSRALHEGLDVCTACWSTRALLPDEQQCPACGASRACAVCKHRIEANQHACPECGRAVWGRARREATG
jgi:RNA polymerase subunit RPABC4/transcription elongation factor Spt4